MSQLIAVVNETTNLEKRVALTPHQVKSFSKLGYRIGVESNAGDAAGFTANAYEQAGAIVYRHRKELLSECHVLVKLNIINDEEIEWMQTGSTFIGFTWPAQKKQVLDDCARRGIDIIAMDCVPRISRAQSMDAMSAMANIAGYRAVVEAAHQFGRFFTGQITAAGNMPPAKVLVIGAGVAGLAAVAAAKGLGAVVRAFDTRPEVADQVSSLGAEFLQVDIDEDGAGGGGYAKEMSQAFLDAEHELFMQQAKDVDIIITTALIPGKPAPTLITREAVEVMKPGSVIIDLAAAQGGNCELTRADTEVTHQQVKILGYTNLPSRLARQSSELYATNLLHLITLMTPGSEGRIELDMEDVIHRQATVVHDKKVIWPPPALPAPAPKVVPNPAEHVHEDEVQTPVKKSLMPIYTFWLIAGAALLGLGAVAPQDFMARFSIFVLSVFIGWQVIWNVSHSLHTPLMAVTNAISGIIVIGALVSLAGTTGPLITWLSAIAVLVATINIVGGFFVTHRMLKMFRK